MKHWLVALLLLGLGGCAGTPTLPPVADPAQAWQSHRQALERLHDWQLTGRIAIRTENEGWHASLDWRQQAQGYLINLTGPLGQGSVQMEGDGRHVTLRSGEESVVDDDPERLLYYQLGWRVPVPALRYWVLGLPAPGPAEQELNAQGHLARLRQADWNIEFRDYAAQGAWVLPGRIFVSNHQAQVRLVIDRFEPL